MSKELIFEGPFKDVIPQYIEYKKGWDPLFQLQYRYSYCIIFTSQGTNLIPH